MHSHALDSIEYLNRGHGWLHVRLGENHNFSFYFVKKILHWDDKETISLNSNIPRKK